MPNISTLTVNLEPPAASVWKGSAAIKLDVVRSTVPGARRITTSFKSKSANSSFVLWYAQKNVTWSDNWPPVKLNTFWGGVVLPRIVEEAVVVIPCISPLRGVILTFNVLTCEAVPRSILFIINLIFPSESTEDAGTLTEVNAVKSADSPVILYDSS